jgi:hypothetical protein
MIKTTFSVQDSELFNASISNQSGKNKMDGEWETAFGMYLMMSYHATREYDKLIFFFEQIFMVGSPTMIAQVILLFLNGKNKPNADENQLTFREKDMLINTVGELYQSLEMTFNWKLGKIDLALSSTSTLLTNRHNHQFGMYKEEISKCTNENKCNKIYDIIASLEREDELIRKVSTHPVHILNNNLEKNPSAFIPFCKFSKRTIGMKIDEFSNKVCSGFKESLVDKQICYSLDVNDLGGTEAINEENALIMLLDYNVKRSTELSKPRKIVKVKSSDLKFLNRYERQKKSANGAKIYMDTLEELSDDGGGRYELSAVKLIKTTPGFEKFSEEKTGCQTSQTYAQCYGKNVASYTKMQCGCVPFHLMNLGEFGNVSTKLKI